MDQRTADALEASIGHWDANARAKTPGGAAVGAADCALCELFIDEPDPCKDCPVRTRTGERSCKATPYNTAFFAYRLWEDHYVANGLRADDVGDVFRATALIMRDFLVSLREPVEAAS